MVIFYDDDTWQSAAQYLSQKVKTTSFHACNGGNSCSELTHMLLGHNRVSFTRAIDYTSQSSTAVDIATAMFSVVVIAISASDLL